MRLSEKIGLFIFIFFMVQSCKNNDKPKYENEVTLIKYLKEKQNLVISSEKKYAISIMQMGMCGACTEFNKTKIVEYFSLLNNQSIKILILSDKDEKIQKYFLGKFGNNLIVFVDNGVDISKYGLRYSKDLLLEISNNSVSEYTFLEGH
jgi:hypothetical protein